jgi:putative transposase
LPCFAGEVDYTRYLLELKEAAYKHGCAIHAYVLMTNHVHLLVTPSVAGAISRMMQMLGRRYVGSFNARYSRSGSLWEGRYKSCVVDSEDYVLRCYRYIDLNPVRARMVASPEAYRWSSYGYNGLGAPDALLRPHASYLALGRDEKPRQQAYAELISEALNEDELLEIRDYLRQGRALGGKRFQEHIESLHGRVAITRSRGRPSQGERK